MKLKEDSFKTVLKLFFSSVISLCAQFKLHDRHMCMVLMKYGRFCHPGGFVPGGGSCDWHAGAPVNYGISGNLIIPTKPNPKAQCYCGGKSTAHYIRKLEVVKISCRSNYRIGPHQTASGDIGPHRIFNYIGHSQYHVGPPQSAENVYGCSDYQ